MDIKELDKKQLILLTLLITFVVSIGTGIVTVSLMNQMPKSVPQTINNVIQRTIEKVTTIQAPAPTHVADNTKETQTNSKENSSLLLGNGDTLVNIYLDNNKVETSSVVDSTTDVKNTTDTVLPTPIGQGIIISDVGLILIDSSLINDKDSYSVVLDKKDFNVSILKKFNNGFTVLKITEKSSVVKTPEVTTGTDTASKTQ